MPKAPFVYRGIVLPYHLQDGLDLYVSDGIPTGGFLQAVLENNLMEAFWRADDVSINAMFTITAYLYNEMPSNSHGSPEKVDAWLKLKAKGKNDGR